MLILLRLSKVPLCLLIGVSALFGYLFGQPDGWQTGLRVAFAVFLVAAGAATFNSIQERHVDGRMERTSNRPLVTGEISLPVAYLVGFIFAAVGLVLLKVISTFSAALGLLALLLYNLVYTPLKKVSIWALVPGAICGALPPVIGLSCTAMPISSFPGLLIFSMLVLWQFPHFWLVMLAHREDYLGVGLPNFFLHFTDNQLRRLFITWVSALAFVMLLFTVIPDSMHIMARIFILLNTISLLVTFSRMPHFCTAFCAKKLFVALNLFLLLHMAGIVCGRVLS